MSSKYEFIDAEKALHPIVKMCEWMAVSTSGFYEWRGRPSSATTARRAELRLLIGKVFADSDDTYLDFPMIMLSGRCFACQGKGFGVGGAYDLTAGSQRSRWKMAASWSCRSVVSVSLRRALGRPTVEG